MLDALLEHYGVIPSSFENGMKLLTRAVELTLALKKLELQRRPVPQRRIATLQRLEQQLEEQTGTSLHEWQQEVLEAHAAVRRRNRPPLPHRMPSRRADEEAPADVPNAPDATPNAQDAEYALPGPASPPPATPQGGQRPLVAGPGEPGHEFGERHGIRRGFDVSSPAKPATRTGRHLDNDRHDTPRQLRSGVPA